MNGKNKKQNTSQKIGKIFLLLFLLLGFTSLNAQTLLRSSREELLNIYGSPDKVYNDTQGYEVMQYEVEENHSETITTLPEQTIFYLKNGLCKKKEHIMLARFYAIQTKFFDHKYTRYNDQKSMAWITDNQTFYRMSVIGMLAIYTEETFE